MNLRVFILAIAAITVSQLMRAETHSDWLSAAIDANGVRYHGSDYPGIAPWTRDVIYGFKPVYPVNERGQRHTGSGLVRLKLDLKSGTVSDFTLLKSSGYRALDYSATSTFRQWRWKPGKWKEVDVPFTFILVR